LKLLTRRWAAVSDSYIVLVTAFIRWTKQASSSALSAHTHHVYKWEVCTIC